MAMRTTRDCTIWVRRDRTENLEPGTMIPVVVVSTRGEERLRSGHPWIYRADVPDIRAEGGDIVQVRSARGRTLGSALFSDRSQITLRMLSYGDQAADEALVRRRIEAAIAFRDSLALDATAYRVVHGEGGAQTPSQRGRRHAL